MPDHQHHDIHFIDYNRELKPFARENRSNPTEAEKRMWYRVLSRRQLYGHKFLRQKPLGDYVVDFYCSALRLVIEIDGDSHAEQEEYDLRRTKALEGMGLAVVRYTNRDVLANLEGVHDDLARVVRQLADEEVE